MEICDRELYEEKHNVTLMPSKMCVIGYCRGLVTLNFDRDNILLTPTSTESWFNNFSDEHNSMQLDATQYSLT